MPVDDAPALPTTAMVALPQIERAPARLIEDVRELDDEELGAILFPDEHPIGVALGVVGGAGLGGAAMAFAICGHVGLGIAAACAAVSAVLGTQVALEARRKRTLVDDLGVSPALVERICALRTRLMLTHKPRFTKAATRAVWVPAVRALLAHDDGDDDGDDEAGASAAKD